MWTVPGQENPLASLLAGGIMGFGEKALENRRQSNLEQELSSLNIDENTSPIDAMRQVLSMRSASPEQQQSLLNSFSQYQKQNQQRQQDSMQSLEDERTAKLIEQKGGKELADYYRGATKGAKSEIASKFFDKMMRDQSLEEDIGEDTQEQPATPSLQGSASVGTLQKKPDSYKWPKIKRSGLGQSPAEASRLYAQREKANNDDYISAADKIKSFEIDTLGIDNLQTLNDSGVLPEGLERINQDPKSGDLIMPAAANTETQLWVKTINGFLRRAKEYFPGRVTNFDLESFKQGLPSLANTEDARRVILKQMELANELMKLDEQSLVNAYDHYGIGNISGAQARKEANSYKKVRKEDLEKRFKTLDGEFNRLAKQRKSEKKSNYSIKMTSPKYGTFDMTPEQHKQALEDKDAQWTPVSQAI